MASLVDIANYALAEIGSETISSLEDPKTTARLCKQHIFTAIKETLAYCPWKSARAQADLAQLVDAPLFAWARAYQLPPDFLELVSFNEMTLDTCARLQYLYEIQGTTLLTNEGAASIVYVKDLTINVGDVNSMPPLVTKACVLNLAAKLCYPLMQSGTLKETLEMKLERTLRKAAAKDANGSFMPTIPNNAGSRWFVSRYSSTNG